MTYPADSLPIHAITPTNSAASPAGIELTGSTLLDMGGNIAGMPTAAQRPRVDLPRDLQDQLIQSRLGIAASLFIALRCKHAETATHSIRVALYCSAWANVRKFNEADRVSLEIAALLHDVGKIGLPEQILTKPNRLTNEERAIVNRHRLMGVEILSTSCASFKVLEIVSNAPSWYDGSRMKFGVSGDQLPLGSRMIAIADAYDAMTTPQVYRPAMSHDRAIRELYDFAGTQFDPTLIEEFASIPTFNPQEFYESTAKNWLVDLQPKTVDSCWQLQRGGSSTNQTPTVLFQQRLLDNMYDAVIFLDTSLQVTFWNRGSERLTGIPATSILQRLYSADLLQMRDERGIAITAVDCPVLFALKSRVQSMRRMQIRGRNGIEMPVNVHTIPVVDNESNLFGAALLLHDATGEVSLEEQCQDWQARATLDPLTKLANRAEFDRGIQALVVEHVEKHQPCSLIICDIDRFKSVNDNYGHQVGDEVLICFAQVLQSQVPPGCIAARYGGEEFVVLCGETNAANAVALADRIRIAIAQVPQTGMGGKSVTSSFGVTELQPGDSPEIMLRRADRALYMAKESGRNKVIQLGIGLTEPVDERKKKRWWQWGFGKAEAAFKRTLQTSVPLPMTIEKLRGFIADYQADVLSTDEQHIKLEVTSSGDMLRRKSDRPETLILDLNFSEETHVVEDESNGNRSNKVTQIVVTATPKRSRNRRREATEESAKQMLASVRAYLMADEVEEKAPKAKQPPAAAANKSKFPNRGNVTRAQLRE